MAAPKNAWQVFDTTEPVLVWRFSASTPDDVAVARVVADVVAALAPLVTTTAPLLTEAEVFAGGLGARFSSRLTGRDERGAIVSADAVDAGAQLRAWEPSLEAAYVRRFAALEHPAVAVWADREGARLALGVGFFSTAHVNARDTEVFGHNHARMVAARDALVVVARRLGARLDAPMSPSAGA